MPFNPEHKMMYMDASFVNSQNTTKMNQMLGETPETQYSHYGGPVNPQSHQNTNSGTMSGPQSAHMFSPSTGSRAPSNTQQHPYKGFRKSYFEHQLNYNIVKHQPYEQEPQDQQVSSEGQSDPHMSNSMGSHPPLMNSNSIE